MFVINLSQVSEKRWYWLKVFALATIRDWDALEKFSKEKRPPIGKCKFQFNFGKQVADMSMASPGLNIFDYYKSVELVFKKIKFGGKTQTQAWQVEVNPKFGMKFFGPDLIG